MSKRDLRAAVGTDGAVFMDVLSHDLLNSSQAILSYLELIITNPSTDPKNRRYAERAASQTRVCALLLEDAKRTMIEHEKMTPLSSVKLQEALRSSKARTASMFPGKRIKYNVRLPRENVWVTSNDILESIITNILVNLVQLDSSDEPEINVRIRERRAGRMAYWSVEFEDCHSFMSQATAQGLVELSEEKNRSVMVKTVGFLFAKQMTEAQGGRFDIKRISGTPERPCLKYTVMLRKARPP